MQMNFFTAPAGLRLIPLEQRSEAWHRWRKGEDLPDRVPRVTGTMAAVIAGDSVMGITPHQLWLQLTGRRPPPEPSEYLRKLWDYGTRMEPIARRAYTEYSGNVVQEACVEHPHHPWAGASLDGLTASCDITTEIKCPTSQRVHNLAKSGQVPSYYLGQCHWQLFCTPTAQELHFWSWFPKDEDREPGALVRVERDPGYEQWLFNMALNFRACVVDNRPPTSDDWLIAARGYRTAKQDLEEAQARVASFQQVLTDLMPEGDDKATNDGGGVRVTRYPSAGDVDYQALFKSLGLPEDQVNAALEASRAPGPVDYAKAFDRLGVAKERVAELERTHRAKGEIKYRVTLLSDFDPDIEPQPAAAPPATPEAEVETADAAAWGW